MPNVFGITARAFRFYEDGTESGATAIDAENTNISRQPAVLTVLRYGVQESGSGSASGATTDDYQLQVSLNAGAYQNVTAASTVVRAVASANLTDAGATTQLLSAGTGAFIAGEISEDGLLDDWQLTANDFSELLYTFEVIDADTATNDTIDFRVLRNGAVFNTYSVTPRITVAASVQNVSPGLLSVPATATAPAQIDQQVTPGLITTSATATAPTIQTTQNVSPGLITSAATALAPSIIFTVEPALLSVTATAIGPARIDFEVSPGLLSQTLTAIAPRLDLEVRPALVSLAASVIAPTSVDQSVSPGLITQAATATAPTRIDQQVAVALLSQALSALAPTRIDQTVTVGLLNQPLANPAPDVTSGSAQTVTITAVLSAPLAASAPTIAIAITGGRPPHAAAHQLSATSGVGFHV